MQKIIQLPEYIISRIAAGEVIERPADAVKELLENSIDAKANRLVIEVEGGGIKLIRISDNGEGMEREDLRECYKPHTTSKLKVDDSLIGIRSMGFRGEALASIASISNLTIQSRTKNSPTGTLLRLEEGRLVETTPVGMSVGTTITIENLFHTVPARKKFLKSEATEFRKILEIVVSFVLGYPSITFKLSNNKKVVLDIATTDQSYRREIILGSKTNENLLGFNSDSTPINLSGFISNPKIASQSVKNYIFVNNRKISDRVTANLIKDTYGTLLEPKSHPFFILHITMPHEMVDVNIHPRKEQIDFLNRTELLKQLKEIVIETLKASNITYSDLRWQSDATYEQSKNKYSYEQLRDGGTNTYAGELIKQTTEPWNVYGSDQSYSSITQFHRLYLAIQTKDGICLIDQHAAHERILYEQYLTEFDSKIKNKVSSKLEEPLALSVSIQDAALLEENKKIFFDIGFEFSIGKNSIIVTKVPIIFQDREIYQLLQGLIDDFREDSLLNAIDEKSHRMLAYLACRNAIKAGDILTPEQAKRLVEKLQKTKNNLTCPHGRPIRVNFELQTLHKMFKRIK
jgi:DNA mismatch repair protein MutL